MKSRSCFFFLFLISSFFLSQNQLFYFHYTTDDGLPSNTVYDIKESPKGIITLGTDNGVSFLNGQNFLNINVQNGLDRPFIIALRYHENNDLYIGNYMGKLQRLKGSKIYNLPTNCETIDEIICHNDTLFLKSYDTNYNSKTKGSSLGILYRKIIGGSSVENFVFDYNNLYQNLNPIFSGYVKDVPVSVNNDDALIFIENRLVKTKNFSVRIPEEVPSVFKAILKGESLLLFSNNHFFEINSYGKVLSKIKLPFPIINEANRFAINMDKRNRIWLSLQKKGLFVFEEKKWQKVNEWIGLQDNENINNLYCDTKGKIWIGTHEKGLYCIPDPDIRFFFTNSHQNFFNSFFIYKESLYTSNRYEFFQVTQKGILRRNIPIRNEFNLGTIGNQPVFNGTNPDLQNSDIFEDIKGYSGKKTTLLKDGRLLIFGSREIQVFEKGKTTYLTISNFKNEKFYHILEYNKQLLCNVGNRLFYASIKGNIFKETGNFNYQPQRSISDLFLKGDTLLIAENSKLHFYRNKKIIKTISEVNGVKLDNINTVSVKNDAIWIAAVNGLFKLSSKSSFILNKYNFLPDNDVQSLHFYQDCLFVGTKNGLAKININLITKKSLVPEIFIKNCFVDSKRIKVNTSILNLEPNDLHLKLIPEVINYQSAKNQLTAFRLDDGDWKSTPSHSIELLSFPYGNHTITIRIKDVNSDWNYLTLKINKRYPFYMTFWFGILILSLSGLLIYYYLNQKIRRIKKKNEEDMAIHNKMVELRQSALSAMMNPHFVFNSLNAIQYFVNTNQNELSGEYLAKLSRLVRLFLNQSSEPYISLKDEISRLKMYVELEQLRFYPFNFKVLLNNIPEAEKIRIPNMIIQPFIENAVIHGVSHLEAQDGQIILNVKLSGDELTIEISDSGFGLQENQNISNHISKGIAIIKERFKALSQLHPDKIFQLEEKPVAINEERKGHLVILIITLV